MVVSRSSLTWSPYNKRSIEGLSSCAAAPLQALDSMPGGVAGLGANCRRGFGSGIANLGPNAASVSAFRRSAKRTSVLLLALSAATSGIIHGVAARELPPESLSHL